MYLAALVLLAVSPRSTIPYTQAPISCLFDNELFSVLNKAAGIPFDETDRDRRGAVSLNAWMQSNVRPSRLADALAVPRCVPLWKKQVGGLVVISKTRQTDELLLQSPASITYACLMAGRAQEGANKQVLETSESATFSQGLSLMLLHTTNIEEDIRASLYKEGTPIVGTPGARLTEGGLMMALVSLRLPSALLELDSSCPTVFEIPIPKKFYKTLKREGLHAQRQKLAEGVASQGATEDVDVTFMGVPLKIGSKHLIPRSSSECLVSTALEELATIKAGTAASVLDLGCGCGALLLATLVGGSKPVYGVGVDLDEEALALAERNAKVALASHNGEVRFLRMDFGRLFEPACREALGHNDGFHVILCNPPYLPQKASAGRWTSEADEALFAGSDGLDAYRVIAESVAKCQPPLLSVKGKLLLQLSASPKQEALIKKIFEHQGFVLSGSARPDNRGIARCLVLQLQR
jgi:methylase of polypeptide subunit release factors